MSKTRNWIVGLTIVSLLAVGVLALAGSGFGGGAADWALQSASPGECRHDARDADGDGVPNADDLDWTCPQDGSGCNGAGGIGCALRGRSLDRSGCGDRRVGGRARSGSGSCGGGCF